jgi:hypothetical protein
MKITIRTNPEIVIDVDSIEEKRQLHQQSLSLRPRARPMLSRNPYRRLKKGVRASGIAKNVAKQDIVLIIALVAVVAR